MEMSYCFPATGRELELDEATAWEKEYLYSNVLESKPG